MWNIKEINLKKDYVTERLKNCDDLKEKEKLNLSLASYKALLDNSGTLRYTGLYNTMDKLTENKFSEKQQDGIEKLELFSKNGDYIDNDYLQFLVDLCNNIARTKEITFDDKDFSPINTDYKNMLDTSYDFYNDLGDTEILANAKKLLLDESSINISKLPRRGMDEHNGLSFNDYVFNKAYITMTKQNNIFDYQVLNHEVMNGVDFYIKNKVPSENYVGFNEVPAYTMDYLFIDYLSSKGMDENEIQKLKLKKDNYLKTLATSAKTQIRNGLIRNNKYQFTMDDIREILSPELTKQLLELEAGVVSYGLYNQIKMNKQRGLDNLKKFMQNILPKSQTPNFSFIDLDNETLLKLSKQIGTYSKDTMNLQDNKNIKR